MENKLTNLEKEAEEYANNFRFIAETDSWFNNKCNSFIAGATSNYVNQQIIKGKIKILENAVGKPSFWSENKIKELKNELKQLETPKI